MGQLPYILLEEPTATGNIAFSPSGLLGKLSLNAFLFPTAPQSTFAENENIMPELAKIDAFPSGSGQPILLI